MELFRPEFVLIPMRNSLLLATLAATLGLAGCDVDFDDVSIGPKEEETFHYSYDCKPGSRLLLENYNGAVEITAWDQPKIEIDGARFANTKERLRQVKIDISRGADSMTIRTVPPLDRGGNSGARYQIRVPKQVVLELIKSTNGSLRVSGTNGAANLRTTNGAIELRLPMGLKNDVRASTSNGSIEVKLPHGAAFQVAARTSGSSIRSDFNVEGEVTKKRIEGKVGGGGALLDLSTSNGSISLQRGL